MKILRIFLLAVGIGITTWCIVTHQPTWLIVFNVTIDAFGVLDLLTRKS